MANRFATDRPVEEHEELENGDAMPMESVYFKGGKRQPMPAYRYKPYPRVKYHAEKDPITVIDEEDEASLGKGWEDVPLRQQDGDTRQPQRRQK